MITSTRKSYNRTLPNKVFEAIAAGVPMIASPTTALAQLFETNDLGILCDPTDPQAIADTARRLYNMPSEELQAMGQCGRQTVCEQYGRDYLAGKLLNMLQSVTRK